MQGQDLWVQAEAAVQAQLDLDVLEEAAGLAEAEIADLTMAGLLADSIGLMVSIRLDGEVVRGVINAASPMDQWIRIGQHTLIRRDAIRQISGLAQVCAATWDTDAPSSGSHSAGSHSAGSPNTGRLHRSKVWGVSGASWLREQIGRRIHITSGRVVIAGVLAHIGSDFLTVIVNGGAEVIALGGIDLVKILG